MRFCKTLLAVAGLIVVAMPLRAEQAKTAAPTQASSHASAQVVCHREPITGSHLTRKVCTTKQQRDERREHDRNQLERIQRDSAMNTKHGS